MEEYALKRLEKIFHCFQKEPICNNGLYAKRSKLIVNALKKKYPYENTFRIGFWKILYNLVLNKPACKDNLNRLFKGKWKSAEDFVDATDDELDDVKSKFRHDIRHRSFVQKQISNEIMKRNNGSGLTCPVCKSDFTDYTLLQTSRGDEGSTARVVCNNCNHRWKFR